MKRPGVILILLLTLTTALTCLPLEAAKLPAHPKMANLWKRIKSKHFKLDFFRTGLINVSVDRKLLMGAPYFQFIDKNLRGMTSRKEGPWDEVKSEVKELDDGGTQVVIDGEIGGCTTKNTVAIGDKSLIFEGSLKVMEPDFSISRVFFNGVIYRNSSCKFLLKTSDGNTRSGGIEILKDPVSNVVKLEITYGDKRITIDWDEKMPVWLRDEPKINMIRYRFMNPGKIMPGDKLKYSVKIEYGDAASKKEESEK